MSTEPNGKMIRVVVADDEPPARELLVSMLEEHRDISIVGVCTNGSEAVQALIDLEPDLLFLDIRMPELGGFEVLDRISPLSLPAIVFVTAYDQYAIRAFDVQAIDYILKPFDEERLERTVARAREYLAGQERSADLSRQIFDLLRELKQPPRGLERIVIRQGESLYLQPTAEVDWFEADGKNVRVHVGSETHVIREGIGRLTAELDASRWVRVSRSAIVNVEKIRELRAWFGGDYIVVMKNGERVASTRGYREELRALIGR